MSTFSSSHKVWLSVTVALYPLKMALLLLVVVEVHLEDLRDHLWVLTLTQASAALATSASLAKDHNRWPGSRRLFLLAGTTYCHIPLCPPPPPLAAQMAGCSLVRFLWCMLWWRTSSSERANFFWQLDQRHVKGFSPDKEGTRKKTEKQEKALL